MTSHLGDSVWNWFSVCHLRTGWCKLSLLTFLPAVSRSTAASLELWLSKTGATVWSRHSAQLFIYLTVYLPSTPILFYLIKSKYTIKKTPNQIHLLFFTETTDKYCFSWIWPAEVSVCTSALERARLNSSSLLVVYCRLFLFGVAWLAVRIMLDVKKLCAQGHKHSPQLRRVTAHWRRVFEETPANFNLLK